MLERQQKMFKTGEQAQTWMGKIFTATYSFSSWAFHTQPKRPLAFTSISCSGLCPNTGDGGEGPGSWRQRGALLLRLQLEPTVIKALAVLGWTSNSLTQ